jgi:uncharacterized cupredoxin-like copper-binding protein
MVGWIAGVVALFAVGAAPIQDASWSDTSRIEVALANFKFVPSTITLHHGQRYVLHLANQASGGHDFVAPEFFAAASVAPEDRDKVTKGEIELGGGDSVDIRLTAPAAPGSYKLRCSHFMHAAFGMKGTIVVD